MPSETVCGASAGVALAGCKSNAANVANATASAAAKIANFLMVLCPFLLRWKNDGDGHGKEEDETKADEGVSS